MFMLWLIVFVGGSFYIGHIITSRVQKGIQDAKGEYDRALQSKNKVLALSAGREYYKKLRGGTLSITDEMCIMNDINAVM